MTKQQQNDIIIQHIDAELRETPNLQIRIANTFNKWFQSLVQMAAAATTSATQPIPEEEETQA